MGDMSERQEPQEGQAVRRLGAHLQPEQEGVRYTQVLADLLLGQTATLSTGLWGSITGTVVAAVVRDDEMLGHGMWVEVEAP